MAQRQLSRMELLANPDALLEKYGAEIVFKWSIKDRKFRGKCVFLSSVFCISNTLYSFVFTLEYCVSGLSHLLELPLKILEWSTIRSLLEVSQKRLES